MHNSQGLGIIAPIHSWLISKASPFITESIPATSGSFACWHIAFHLEFITAKLKQKPKLLPHWTYGATRVGLAKSFRGAVEFN